MEMWQRLQLVLMETRVVHAFACVASVDLLALDQQDSKCDSHDVGH